MSVQIFLQGKLLGIDEFLGSTISSDPTAFLGRSHWISLITELIPRGLLAELGLAKILLGASGGDQFLVVVPAEARQNAFDILANAAADIERLTSGAVQLVHASTENLGDWSDVRKRINEEMGSRRAAPARHRGPDYFAPFTVDATDSDEYFAALASGLRTAKSAGWSPDQPGRVLLEQGKHTWPLDGSSEAIPFVRHEAPRGDDGGSATPAQLGERASGQPIWGVLRGDVDNFAVRLRRLQTIEEHLQISITYKQFFAGELKIQCSLPDFWRKTNIIYSGGDDFAVVGAWDALLPLARELQRVFQRFAAENLKDLPGAEGKTLTMALALAPSQDASLGSVFLDAGRRLEIAKSADKDCIYALGRILEWKQLADAASLKDELTRLVTEFGTSPEYIDELCGIYRETATSSKLRGRAAERPWRFHRRVNRILPQSRDREFQKARAEVIADLAGKNPAHVKLRPSGRVALEWARLSIEDQNHRG